uniref:Smoothelin, like n=1 Tax=Tetraodon nigroviridis TaxID=99883 RepID=H3D9V7_TETNG
ADMGDLCHPRPSSPEGETVCAALARYENTLRDAIREIHVDVSAFKLGVERRLEETANLSGPLGRAVLQLQQENRQLRGQLEALTRQVELLGGMACERNALLHNSHYHNHKNHSSPASCSPPVGSRVSSVSTGPASGTSPSPARFSSRATFAVSSKSNSIEKDEPIEVDHAPTHGGLENGHSATTEPSALAHGKVSPPTGLRQEHTAPVATPHLPITATTKVAEIKSPGFPSSPAGSPPSPVSEESPGSQSAEEPAPAGGSSPQRHRPVSASGFSSAWAATPVRPLGSPRLQERLDSAPAKSVTYSGLPQDRDGPRWGDRRRELVRSQTLPRNIGAQARRSIFERLDADAGNSSRPLAVDSKPKLKRSQSFGVSSASSIKQILLEWCRSKTLGYQNIDIQNFSSSWSDGMAFCALVHSFFPTEFDYSSLSPANRKHNFELAFGTAEAKAGCDRLIEVEDMMIMGRKPDPMCVFTYVQSLYNHLRKFE